MSSIEDRIFRNGSTTYYFSSRFFPKAVRADVFRLYSFVRVADDYVDCLPGRPEELVRLRRAWRQALKNTHFDTTTAETDDLNTRVVKNMVQVSRTYNFDPAWTEAFLASMQMDVDRRQYQTVDDTLEYIYGSAEVIGLMMARILGLPHEADSYARLQGRAMQFINFLRDIAEDNQLGRCYFPLDDLQRFGLHDLRQPELGDFNAFMRFELERYQQWQAEADDGFRYIPRTLRIPLQTAVDMYNWTGREIAKDPRVVFTRKLKPHKRQVMMRAGRLLIDPRA